jgi:selenocysteine lyase/cysteine desulfurase
MLAAERQSSCSRQFKEHIHAFTHHENAKRISAAHVSNEDSREHIRASREAIARSFETLAMPYSRTGSSG